MKLFGTDGIRGRVDEFPITAEVFHRAGKAVADVLLNPGQARNRVLVGRDTRVSGRMLEEAVTRGLMSMGVDVQLVGVIPTPAVALLTRSAGASAGIMLTASHNPYEDNGLKIFGPDGYKLDDRLEEAVERHIQVGDDGETASPPIRAGSITRMEEAGNLYVGFVKDAVGDVSLTGLKVVVDCGNGACHQIGPAIFKELGAEVIATGDQPDGRNINEGVGALHPERAGELVRRVGADLGISFDGDGDRVIFTDADGRVVSGDRVLGLCAIALKEEGRLAKDTLVATIMSNLGLREAMKRKGIRFEATQVGDRNVIELMRRHGYSFGGENSGHLVFAEHSTTGDGIFSSLQILRIMRRTNQPVAGLADMMTEYPSQLENIPVRAKPALDTLPGLTELMKQASDEFGDDGRHLIRYSGTEKKIRVLVEHRDLETCRLWSQRFAEAVRSEIG